MPFVNNRSRELQFVSYSRAEAFFNQIPNRFSSMRRMHTNEYFQGDIHLNYNIWRLIFFYFLLFFLVPSDKRLL